MQWVSRFLGLCCSVCDVQFTILKKKMSERICAFPDLFARRGDSNRLTARTFRIRGLVVCCFIFSGGGIW